MRRPPALPAVTERAPVADVVREMSDKRLGCTAVTDAGGVLVGIVTDGDLRRAVQRGGGTLPAIAADLMNRVPKTVGRSELAAAALELMERHAITQLLVVDDAGRPDGIIHLHDLLRAGIA
jgi:arabinose-5-phosphate isomerase